jgi:hypothetical protein
LESSALEQGFRALSRDYEGTCPVILPGQTESRLNWR